MPNKALFRFTINDTLDQKVCAFILLVTANYLKLTKLLICRENGEITENIQNSFVLNHRSNAALHIGKSSFILAFRYMPGTPVGYATVDSTITETLAFCSKVKDIGNKHAGNALFIIQNILGTVDPGNSFAGSSLDLTDYDGETVDQQNDIQPFAALYLGINPLICDHITVLSHLFFRTHSEVCNRDETVVLTKGESILLEDLIFEFLVKGDKICSPSLHKQGAQFNDNLVCIGRISGDFRI